MSVLKYKSPVSGEYKITRTVKVVGDGGAAEQLVASGSPVQYDAWRMCIPNGQFNRENYYGEVGGINFAEAEIIQ